MADKTKEVLQDAVKELTKGDIEFSRYKQDCRKRALEMAMGRTPFIKEEKDWEPSNEQIKKLSDDLYKWLIEIPS